MVLDKAVVVGLEAQEHAALAAAKDTAQLAALQPAAPGELDHRLRPVVDHVQPDGILRLGSSDVEQRRPQSGLGQGSGRFSPYISAVATDNLNSYRGRPLSPFLRM